MTELQEQLDKARERVAWLERLVAKGGEDCTPESHNLAGRQSMMGGYSRENVKRLTGHDIDHNGYSVWECIACGKWFVMDYCGGAALPVTAEAAKELIG